MDVRAAVLLLSIGTWTAAVPSGAPQPTAGSHRREATGRRRPTPTPRPRVEPTPRPPDEQYDKLRKMAVDEIDHLNLLGPVYFAEASADIREIDKPVLANNAAILKRFDFLTATLEARCDSRGAAEYNMWLGDRRAKAVLKHMVALGVPASRLRAVSYGKEVPVCSGDDEECLKQSRSVIFAVSGKLQEP
jgi:peptidoglycan-associated lipoprotein